MNRPIVTESLKGGYIVVFDIPFEGDVSEKIMINVEEDGIVNVTFNQSNDEPIWVSVQDDTVIINAF